MTKRTRTNVSSTAVPTWIRHLEQSDIDTLFQNPFEREDPDLRSVGELVEWLNRERTSESMFEAHDKFIAQEPSPELLLTFLLGRYVGWQSGRTSLVASLRGALMAHANRMTALGIRNAGKEVMPSERERLMRLSPELKPEFPRAAPRYREIARRLSTTQRPYKESRVRYIIEGPRKSRKKS